MSNRINVVDSSSVSKPKPDLNDIEMVFGTPNSPESGAKPVAHIANERNHTNSTNKSIGDSDAETHPAQPLLEPDKEPPKPPLAGPETDDLDGAHSHPTVSFPGIDDGLLEPKDNHQGNSGDDAEKKERREPHPSLDPHSPAYDEGVGTDDGKWLHSYDQADHPYNFGSDHGIEPRFGLDDGPFSVAGSTVDPNAYQQRKLLAQGMMDLALLSANSSQLRYVLQFPNDPYYIPSITFISLSILCQVVVGVLLILNSRFDVTDKKEICKAHRINNITVLGVFLITIVNVFIPSFGVSPPNTTITASPGAPIIQQAG